MKHLKECKVCGKKFETPYPSKTYCSLRCRHAAHNERNFITKKCKICGTSFLGSKKKLYCSEKCATIGQQQSQKCRTQLCWTCQRATGFCSWSASFAPVKGWKAKKVKWKDNDFTYRIRECPLYLPDELPKNKKERI